MKHGCASHKKVDLTYRTWKQMRYRCRNTHLYSCRYWGGKGITIDPTWDDFTTFLSDMGPRPSINHSIDRIDSNGNYTKNNCQWVTKSYNSTKQPQKPQPIQHITQTGQVIQSYAAIKDAAAALGLAQESVSRAARGIYKQTKGCYFRFISELIHE